MSAAVAPLLVLALAQGPGPAPVDVPPPVVSLPVVVRDARDRPVTTLTAQDFIVTDGGVAVRVVDARFVTSGANVTGRAGGPPQQGPDPREPAIPEPGSRVFAFFLDEYHVAAADSARVRELLRDFVQRHTDANDWFLVVKPLDPLLALSPRRGSAAVLAAIASFEGRLGDYAPRSAFERELIAAEPARIDRARARIAASAVHAITTRLAQLGEARKAFLVVGQEFEPLRAAGRLGDPLPSIDAVVRAAERGNVSISTLDPRLIFPAPMSAPPVANVASSQAARVDPSDSAATSDRSQSLLGRLVRLTDGRALRAPFEGGLSGVAADLGDYYVLTLDAAGDGQYHALEVGFARPGLRARARPGYWAPNIEVLARVAREMARPAAFLPPPLHSSSLIVPWVGQEWVAADRTRVTLVWDPAPTRAGERARGLPPSRVVVRATAADGTGLFDGTVQALSGGMSALSVATFEARPGRMRLQMSIQDASARELDTDVREVVVTAAVGAVGLGTPRVFRARTAREYNALAANPRSAPSASRTFTRAERLLFRVPWRATSMRPPVVRAELVTRTGHVMRELSSGYTSEAPFVTTDLPLAGLAAGEYTVRWHATLDADEARETVSFRVTP